MPKVLMQPGLFGWHLEAGGGGGSGRTQDDPFLFFMVVSDFFLAMRLCLRLSAFVCIAWYLVCMSKQKQSDAVMVRIPKDLAARIDEAAEAAGGVPRERWVRRALEKLLVPESKVVTAEGRRIVDLDVDPLPAVTQARREVAKGIAKDKAATLQQFKCSVCGLRTVGGPCQKHPKASEAV